MGPLGWCRSGGVGASGDVARLWCFVCARLVESLVLVSVMVRHPTSRGMHAPLRTAGAGYAANPARTVIRCVTSSLIFALGLLITTHGALGCGSGTYSSGRRGGRGHVLRVGGSPPPGWNWVSGAPECAGAGS